MYKAPAALIFCVLLILPALAAKSQNQSWRIVQSTGDAEVLPPGATTWRAVETHEALPPGVRIRTDSGALVLEISAGNRIFIGERSELSIDASRNVFDTAGLRHRIFATQEKGRVVAVLKRMPTGSRFELKTPLAVVGGGTVFFSHVSETMTQIGCLKGSLSVNDTITIGARRSIRFTGSNPERVKILSASVRKGLRTIEAAIERPAAPARQRCISGLRVRNATAAPVSVSVSGQNLFSAQRIPAGTNRTIQFQPSGCITASISSEAPANYREQPALEAARATGPYPTRHYEGDDCPPGDPVCLDAQEQPLGATRIEICATTMLNSYRIATGVDVFPVGLDCDSNDEPWHDDGGEYDIN